MGKKEYLSTTGYHRNRGNTGRHHGDDAEYNKAFSEFETWTLDKLDAEHKRLVELRSIGGISVTEIIRLKACWAAILQKEMPPHWMGTRENVAGREG